MDTQKVRQNMEPMAQIVLGAGVSVAFHPLTYTKVLIQLGHEPLGPTPTTSVFGRKVLAYPSAFKYLGHIRKTDGFLGMYRGLGPRLAGGVVGSIVTSHVSSHLKQLHPVNESEIDEEENQMEIFKRLCHETTHEMIARCAGAIASQPFQVIMVRSMAQFVGRETKYDNIFSAISAIWNEDGILGFFAGLAPRLLGEALTVWLVNMLVHAIDTYLIPKSQDRPQGQGPKSFKTYSSAVCTMMVTQLTYPFNLVSNIMAVAGCGLEAGSPPHMPVYDGWRDCLSTLFSEGQMKRGSSLFWRYYKGPVTFRHDGRPIPVGKMIAQ